MLGKRGKPMPSRALVGITARNEEEGLRIVLPEVPCQVGDTTVNVLVIDDGSTDNTAEVAYQHNCEVVTNPTSQGFGNGRKTILRSAVDGGYDWVVTMDGDGQHRPEHVVELLQRLMCGSKVVRASRYHPSLREYFEQVPSDWLEQNERVTVALNSATGWHLTDALCGMMGMPVSVARQVLPCLRWDNYGYAVEVLFCLAEIVYDFEVEEVPHPPVYNLTEAMEQYYAGDLTARRRRYDEHLEQIKELARRNGGSHRPLVLAYEGA